MNHPGIDPVDRLAARASGPGAHPCDRALAAMPARVLGDLDPGDAAWLLDHVATCRSCGRELEAFMNLDTLVGLALEYGEAPAPAVRLPRTRPVAWFARCDSPIGPLLMAASENGLCELTFEGFRGVDEVRDLLAERDFDARPAGPETPAVPSATLVRAAEQLAEYFDHTRTRFDLPLDFQGVTPFTRSVLDATASVPFGRLETYRGIASRIGKPGASRAVGNALGRNPLPVVVPCHRVVATGGGIGGYTGGLAIKERLLSLEGARLA